MPDKTTHAELAELADENTRLRGQMLATGVILTQLLQSICKTQLNPHAFAGKVIKQATDAVHGFKPEGTDVREAEAMKAAALETVGQYETQIKSVLPI
jgi:hypothetical protein